MERVPTIRSSFQDLLSRNERPLICLRSYSVYRRITDYYADGSDAFDMRKPLKRDKARKTVRANGETIKVDPGEVW